MQVLGLLQTHYSLLLMTSYAINLKPLVDHISDLALLKLSSKNPELRFETDAKGNLIVMSLRGGLTGIKNGNLLFQIYDWNRQHKSGVVIDPSGGFRLSNNAVRCPNVSWVSRERWNSLTDEQKEGIPPIAPEFVSELMSTTDDLLSLRQKMSEYMSCDVKLGWLINPDDKEVEIYRMGQDKEVLNNPTSVSGENVMPNLIVDLSNIF